MGVSPVLALVLVSNGIIFYLNPSFLTDHMSESFKHKETESESGDENPEIFAAIDAGRGSIHEGKEASIE